MTEILDEVVIKRKHTNFSKIAGILSLITVSIFFIYGINSPRDVEPGQPIDPQYPVLVLLIISSLIAFIATVIGLVKKEKMTWYKWVSAIFNCLIFSLILILLIMGTFEALKHY